MTSSETLKRLADVNYAPALVDQPVPLEQWPRWATWIAGQKSEADAGVGDTVNRLLGSGGELFKAAMGKMGIPCGCAERRAEWNRLYPY